MKKRISLRDLFRYWFDGFMAKGTAALISGLAALSLLLIVIAAAAISLTGLAQEDGASLDFFEAAWAALMRTLDAGTMGGDTGWGFRAAMFVVTLGGIFIISTLIGVLSAGIEARLELLRKGRSKVIERDHTVILGWNEAIFPIIQQLTVANENRRRACVVILSDRDKVEMEDEIAERIRDARTTKIVCRTGKTDDPADLGIASVERSRSIIVLSSGSSNPDADTIKTLLALANGTELGETCSVVAEIRDPKNVLPARIASAGRAETLLVGNLIARLIAQTCLQSGLSGVYLELLDFEGDEIYFSPEKGLEGATFREAIGHYETSTVMGLVDADGKPMVNPPMDTRIGPGWKVIAISEDDDTVLLGPDPKPFIREDLIVTDPAAVGKPRSTVLVLGANWRVPIVVRELSEYLAEGSGVRIASSSPGAKDMAEALAAGLSSVAVGFVDIDITDRDDLESLDLSGIDHAVVMSESDDFDEREADSRTLVTLIHLRDILKNRGLECSITSEILDVRNRELAEVTQADDFIVSDKLVSLMLAQVAENPGLNAVLGDLFDPEGSEVYLKPARDYVKTGLPVNFHTVSESSVRRNEVAIGYRLARFAHDSSKAYGIVVNPRKSDEVVFGEDDRIVVIAEE